MFHTQKIGSHIQGQGHNQESEVKYFLCDYLILAEAHCIKLSKKVNHNQKVCHTLFYVPKLKVKVTIWDQSSKYVSAITQKSNKANFIQLHRKTKHHERLKVKSFLYITKKLLKQVSLDFMNG